MQNQLFSRQFCGNQASNSSQEFIQYLDTLPEDLKQNSNYMLRKPQESFQDKIDNFSS